ncbi:MAG: TetR/AcrR family transcriptional regulator [Pseudomonadota bacterium]
MTNASNERNLESIDSAMTPELEADHDGTLKIRELIGRELEIPRTKKARTTKQGLLDAGAKIFALKGYEQTRVADITELAAVAHGSFYRYFSDKDAILQELLLELYKELGAATQGDETRNRSSNPLKQLESFNIRFFHEYAKRRGLLRVAREAAASTNEGCFRDIWFAMRGRFVTRTHRYIDKLQSRGLATGLDAHLTAEALGAMSEQMAYVLIGLAQELPSDEQLTAIGKTCNTVWTRTLFPEALSDDKA